MPSILSVKTGGGGEKKPKKTLTPQQRKDWNEYVDFVAQRGYKGSTLLDKKETGLAKKLFDEYKKLKPTASISFEDVPIVQEEMEQLKQSAQAFAARKGEIDANKIMSGISKVDGWPGSRTTQFKFPDMQVQQYHNNALVSSRNLGIVDSNLRPNSITTLKTKIPKSVKTDSLFDAAGRYSGMGYIDPNSGDIVTVR